MITMKLYRLRRIRTPAAAMLLGMSVLIQVACTASGGMATAKPEAEPAAGSQEPTADIPLWRILQEAVKAAADCNG